MGGAKNAALEPGHDRCVTQSPSLIISNIHLHAHTPVNCWDPAWVFSPEGTARHNWKENALWDHCSLGPGAEGGNLKEAGSSGPTKANQRASSMPAADSP